MAIKRRAQALIELAVGMFAFALVISALTGFAVWIAKSLKMQNSLRTGASVQSGTVEVGEFGGKYLFGSEKIKIKESVSMPNTEITIPDVKGD